jgi:hypothetical protein
MASPSGETRKPEPVEVWRPAPVTKVRICNSRGGAEAYTPSAPEGASADADEMLQAITTTAIATMAPHHRSAPKTLATDIS